MSFGLGTRRPNKSAYPGLLGLTTSTQSVEVRTEPPEYGPMAQPNFENRTLYTLDNLEVMRGINSESVDLIYLDPPFNSKKDYAAPIGADAAGAAFKDTWSLDDVKREWVEALATDNTATWSVITAAGFAHGESSQAYLTYMAIRLLEMRRVLKSVGSIYLHCDPTMSHYLKLIMDAVFGRRNFRNEIVWCYNVGGKSSKWWARKHDNLLFYSKTSDYYFNGKAAGIPRDTGTKSFGGRIGTDSAGRPYQDKLVKATGRIYRYYLDEPKIPEDWWTDINSLQSKVRERTGYPTQKPLALLDRIIKASSNEDDVVLDPFCGCATTCIAAERLGRQWVGIDVEEKARDLVVQRLEMESSKEGFLHGRPLPPIYHLRRPPKRTDDDAPKRSRNIKQLLYTKQEGRCKGSCERVLDMDLFEIDHIVPRARGGQDIDSNLQLLCPTCNRRKGSRTMARFLELMEGRA